MSDDARAVVIWTLDGEELDRLRSELQVAYRFRFAVDSDATGTVLKWKRNEGAWTAGIDPDESPS